MSGPALRTDIVDVYIFRRGAAGLEFLQLLRAHAPLAGTWHPVMGHVEVGEKAVDTATREVEEEVGLARGSAQGFWALEQVHPYYVASLDAIVLSPRFAMEVGAQWEPRLNNEHSGARWVREAREFVWSGQRAAVAEILEGLGEALRVVWGQ